MSSIRDLLGAACLPGDSGRLEAELLLSHCLGESRSYLYTWPELDVAADREAAFNTLVAARRAGEPVAYLTGRREFWSLELRVNEHTLIPRPETETLVSWALELDLPAEAAVSDWGTGSGAIALALASERPGWRVEAIDRSVEALAVAAGNGRRLGIANVVFSRDDWGSGIAAGTLDLVVSNPPYVAAGDPHLEQGDLRFEPEGALVAGSDGLDAIRRISGDASSALSNGGWLLLEHGHEQAEPVCELLRAAGFVEVGSRSDLAGIQRISGGRKS
jgi:release factor glutamine methyltransferase